jgi:hypothetical protein
VFKFFKTKNNIFPDDILFLLNQQMILFIADQFFLQIKMKYKSQIIKNENFDFSFCLGRSRQCSSVSRRRRSQKQKRAKARTGTSHTTYKLSSYKLEITSNKPGQVLVTTYKLVITSY